MTDTQTTNTPPARAPIIPTSTEGPPRSAVELASDQARQRLVETGSALPAGDVPDPALSAVAHHAPTQPRTEDGGVAVDARREVGAGALTGEEEAEPSPADHSSPEETKASQEETADTDDSLPEETESESTEATTEDDGETSSDETLVVTLPGPDANTPFEITVSDPETADHLRELAAGYVRGADVEHARNQLANGFEQLDAFKDQLLTDPAGTLVELLPEDPATLEHVALYLLAQPHMWDRVRERVLAWDDPDKLELDQAKLASQRYALRDSARTFVADRHLVQQNLRDIQQAITAMIPADWPVETRQTFYRDAMRDLKEHADSNALVTLPVNRIPLVLADRLADYGINPVNAASLLTRTRTTPATRTAAVSRHRSDPVTPPAQPSAAGVGRTVGGTPSPAPPPLKRGDQFVAGAQRRAAVGRVPTAGAGTPTSATALIPPKDGDGQPMGIEATVAWHRKQVALGKKHL